MAIANQGLGERWIGKIGGVVFQKQKDQVVVKSYQPVVRNPQTEKQVEQRKKIAFLTFAYRQIAGLAINSTKEYTQRLSGFNNFTKYNIENVSYDPANETAKFLPPDLEKVVVSKGSLRKPSLLTAEFEPVDGAVVLGMDIKELAVNEKGTDSINIIAANNDFTIVQLFPSITNRLTNVGIKNIEIIGVNPKVIEAALNNNMMLFCFFQSMDGTLNSDTTAIKLIATR